VLAIAGWVLIASEPSGTDGRDLSGFLILVAWCGGIVTSFAIRRGYEMRVGSATSERVPWPVPTARSRQWSARYALLAYVCTFAGAGALVSVLYFGLGVHVQVGAGVLMVDAVLLVSLVPLGRRRGLSLDDLGIRFVPAARSIGLVVLALVAYGVIAVVWVIVVHPRGGADAFAQVRHGGTVDVVLAIIAVSLSAPIVEEVFFRGLLYRSLRNRLSILPAALLAGMLFGLVHIASYPLDTLAVKAAFGVIACLLYERTGSLLPGIGLHSFIDASAIDLALTGNDVIVLTSFLVLAITLIAHAPVRRAQQQPTQASTQNGQPRTQPTKPR
jgi:membrane protease YdiL (CAAX protease family)